MGDLYQSVLIADPNDRHSRPFSGKSQGHGPANSTAATGYECDFVR
jgi:hypothetical protein